ncbi:MAG: hypothetical protein M1820_009069 [Bogoriella megaspora]|nr:MAG: hypothetical protein M1820_009069 [Bogoriella megaspora]
MNLLPESRRSRQFLLVISILFALFIVGLIRERTTFDTNNWQLIFHKTTLDKAITPSSKFGAQKQVSISRHQHSSTISASNPEKLAYTTWLSSTISDPDSDFNEDVYFLATRILVYQLLHAPQTRSLRGIPVVVLVTPDVSRTRRERLRRDGAIVRPVSNIKTGSDWIAPGDSRWRDVLSKLRVWEMTEYSRVLLLDGDTVLQRSLDGVFDEPNAQVIPSLTNVTNLPDDEAKLPSHYLLASTGELPNANHKYPPDWDDFKNFGTFCAGFLLLEPSLDMFRYYKSILAQPNRFDSRFPEQNLWNYAHRWDGPMPWKQVSSTWNVRSVNSEDFRQGVASMHEKWWQDVFSGSQEVAEWFNRVRWEMEGFYQCWDELGSYDN